MIQRLVDKKVIVAGRAFAEKVYKYRGKNTDKFEQGDEFQADVKGFQVEFAHCALFRLPFTELFDGKKVDEFDCQLAVPNENGLLQLLKFDVKTSKNFLINKEQFSRKKVDAYLFESLDFKNWDCNPSVIFLKIHGWILKKDVKENSELKKFENGSEAYKVNPRALKDPELLGALNQAGGI